MERMRFHVTYVRIGTTDLEKAHHFYENILGLSLITKNIEGGFLLFDLNGITLIVELAAKQSGIHPSKYLGISLKVQDVFHVYNELVDQGVVFLHPPEKQFWGGYLTEFQDPDNNTWTLIG
jgi:catechol 2,3-dioxygenase-like lactoylglutathione lyase family enzyme